MKTAIPTHQGTISESGASASAYTLVEGANEAPVSTTLEIDASLSPEAVFGLLKSNGVERLLAGNLEPEYLAAAETSGLQIFYGASGTIADALNLISLGILDSMANGTGCSGNGCGSGGCGGSCGSAEEPSAAGCGSGCGCGGK